jgi:hypothetical protein
MSWDVELMRVPPDILSAADLSLDFVSELGPRDAILTILKDILPQIDLSKDSWGILDGEDFSIEFGIGDIDPISTITLYVRGNESVIAIIEKICNNTGWRAFDTTTGEFISFGQNAAEGLRRWRKSQEHVIADLESKGKTVIRNAKIGRARLDAYVLTSKNRSKKWWQFWK